MASGLANFTPFPCKLDVVYVVYTWKHTHTLTHTIALRKTKIATTTIKATPKGLRSCIFTVIFQPLADWVLFMPNYRIWPEISGKSRPAAVCANVQINHVSCNCMKGIYTGDKPCYWYIPVSDGMHAGWGAHIRKQNFLALLILDRWFFPSDSCDPLKNIGYFWDVFGCHS